MEKLYAPQWKNYELIDAGGGMKLERWGEVITIRPEVQAYFKSGKPFDEWRRMAHWEFMPKGAQSGTWKSLKKGAPSEWSIDYDELKFELKLTKFKHLGLFPEQLINWTFINDRLRAGDKFLNLFAYTGAASCVAKNAGAETFHVDSVKQLIGWAKSNMEASSLTDIKWVHEDALKFAAREVKRGRNYAGIIMDPPAWGIGAKNEKWKLEDKLEELIQNAAELIDQKGFLIMNTYSPKVDAQLIHKLASRYLSHLRFQVTELWMKSSTDKELFFGNVLRVG